MNALTLGKTSASIRYLRRKLAFSHSAIFFVTSITPLTHSFHTSFSSRENHISTHQRPQGVYAVPAIELRSYIIFPDTNIILAFSLDAKRLCVSRLCHEVTDLPHQLHTFVHQLCERSSLGLPTEHSSTTFSHFLGAKILRIYTILLRKNHLFYIFLHIFTTLLHFFVAYYLFITHFYLFLCVATVGSQVQLAFCLFLWYFYRERREGQAQAGSIQQKLTTCRGTLHRFSTFYWRKQRNESHFHISTGAGGHCT